MIIELIGVAVVAVLFVIFGVVVRHRERPNKGCACGQSAVCGRDCDLDADDALPEAGKSCGIANTDEAVLKLSEWESATAPERDG